MQNSLHSTDREDKVCLVLESVLTLKLGISLLPAFAKLVDIVIDTGVCCRRELGLFFNSEVNSRSNFFSPLFPLFPSRGA